MYPNRAFFGTIAGELLNEKNIMFVLDEKTRARLIEAALEVQKHAYIPYSHYPVGAALLTPDGQIFTGCNVENASFGATICAERTAVVKAVSEGARQFQVVAVVTSNGMFPCGICRQVLNEFGPGMIVIAADSQGNIVRECALADLLPGSFGPMQLEEGTHSHGAA